MTRAILDYRMEIVWYAMIGVTSATLVLVMGVLLAVAARRRTGREVAFALTLAVLAAIPGPLIGSGLLRLAVGWDVPFWNWMVDYTIALPVAANLLFAWPIGGWLVWLVVRATSAEHWEAARLEGAGWLASGWHLGVVPNRRALAGVWLIVAALGFGELSASQMVRPPGMDTLPRKLLGDLHAGVNELTAGIGLVVFLGVIVLAWLTMTGLRLNPTRHGRQ